MGRLAAALGELDAESRALLDLSLRRGMPEEEIADFLGTDSDRVRERRGEILDGLAAALEIENRAGREELEATLPDLPAEAWKAPGKPPPRPDRGRRRERPPAGARGDTGDTGEPAPGPAPAPREPPPRPSLRLLVSLAGGVLIAGVVLGIALATGGEDGDEAPRTESGRTERPEASPRPPVGLTALPAAEGARGTARLSGSGTGSRLRLRLEGLPQPEGRYEIWVYNSVADARSLASFSRAAIDLNARVPVDPTAYRYVDVSLEPADGNRNHSGTSVMRVETERLLGR